jgi:subtilisin family serine protease
MQPDLSAPGIDIIASWSLLSSRTGNANDTGKAQYNIISGTSMACPHASGASAYVKSFQRDWSLAMIMSALITTGMVYYSLTSHFHYYFLDRVLCHFH